MRKSLVLSVLIVICIIVVAVVYLRIISPAGMRAQVAAADDREFFPAIHSMLVSADKSIDVVLYQTRFYFHYPASKSNAMVSDLMDAAERGAEVRVVMERADWNLENTEENRDVAQVLAGSGVEVYYDPPDITSHTKLIIVDGKYVVVGSTNWNHYALDSNNEANVVVDSKRVAGEFTRYFDTIVSESDTAYSSPVEPITADAVTGATARYVLIKDRCDTAYYDPETHTGYVYFDGLKTVVHDSPLEEVLVLDPSFFADAPGETLRVLGRTSREGDVGLDALDIESADTRSAVEGAMEREHENLAKAQFDQPSLDWIKDARVTPLANRTYAPEIEKLIHGAHNRIWVAMLDARYYDSTPSTASRPRESDDPPSPTNTVLGELVEAAVNGVDVRFVCDEGWYGSPPRDRVTFMEKLKAAGGKVYWDSPELTTHAKLIIVDDDFVVVGSTNWTYPALEENNETSVVVQSRELNSHYARYIQALIDEGSPF